MIVNLSLVKTEALLLFCRDLIESYINDDTNSFQLSQELQLFIQDRTKQLLKAINNVIQPTDYYMRNSNVTRISIIIKYYNYINNKIEKEFKNNALFNPSMLCFTLLCSWFTELNIAQNNKEFIYFARYPYGEIYDRLLLNIRDDNFKQLNIKMLNISENIVLKLYNYRYR